MARKLVAEFLGTALLVFFACGVATLMFGFGFDGGSVAAGVVATASHSASCCWRSRTCSADLGLPREPGGHHGRARRGSHQPIEAVGYWIAQFAGGIVGALVLWLMFSASPMYSRTKTGLGADGYGSLSKIHISVGGAFLCEVILTALFVFVILGVTAKTANATTAGLVIGFTLVIVHLIGIAITGTSVNPARSLGPALIVGGEALSQVWLFIVAPLVGGIVAALTYRLLFPARLETETEGLAFEGDRAAAAS